MRVIKVKNEKDQLCRYCLLTPTTCNKANHLKYGDRGKVIECSEFTAKSWFNNFPIEWNGMRAKRVENY